MQQAAGGEAILWSRSHNTVSLWTPELLALGRQEQQYQVSGTGSGSGLLLQCAADFQLSSV